MRLHPEPHPFVRLQDFKRAIGVRSFVMVSSDIASLYSQTALSRVKLSHCNRPFSSISMGTASNLLSQFAGCCVPVWLIAFVIQRPIFDTTSLACLVHSPKMRLLHSFNWPPARRSEVCCFCHVVLLVAFLGNFGTLLHPLPAIHHRPLRTAFICRYFLFSLTPHHEIPFAVSSPRAFSFPFRAAVFRYSTYFSVFFASAKDRK